MIARGVRCGIRRFVVGGCLNGLVSLALVGCGGGESGSGDANHSQKVEKSATPAPAPKVVPDKKGPKDMNDLSPRERREQAK